MMKKLSFLTACLSFACMTQAQVWTSQNTNFSGTSIGVDEISIVDANTVWLKGFNGSGTGGSQIKLFAKTIDGGTTWTPVPFGSTGTIMPACFAASSSQRVFVAAMDTVSSTASFWSTADGGTTWAAVPTLFSATGAFPDGVKFWNGNKGFCYGDPTGTPKVYEIYTTSDGGATWTAAATSVTPTPSTEYGFNGTECAAIVPGSSGVGFIMTDHGRLLRTTDFGVHWALTPTDPFTSAAYNGNKVYASSANYIICATYLTATTTWTWKYTTDGGTTWNAYSPTGPFYQFGMCYVPGTPNKFVASSPVTSAAAGVAYSNDGGQSWIDFTDALLQPSGTNIQCLAVGFSDVTTGWVGYYGTTNSILKYHDISAGVNMFQSLNGNDVNVFPNPSNGLVNISVNGPNNQNIQVSILDMLGNVIASEILNPKLTFQTTIDLSAYSKGMYLVQITSGSEKVVKKLMLK